MVAPIVLTSPRNLREIKMEAAEAEPVAWGANEEGNGAFNIETNLEAQMLPNVPVGTAASEIHDTQSALLDASNVLTMGQNPNLVDDCADREMMHAIQPTIVQLVDQRNSALWASTRKRPALASYTAALRPQKMELQVKPKEEETVVLNSLPPPSILPVIPQDGIYITEAVCDTTALPAPESHIASAAVEYQSLSPVANRKRNVKKRKAPVKFGDDKRRKVKREMLKKSNNLLSIQQFDIMEETIAVAGPDAVAAPEIPISDLTPVAEYLCGPSNPEPTIRGLATKKPNNSIKQSDIGKRGDNIGVGTSQSTTPKTKLKSPLKKPDGRKSAEALRKRLETRRRNFAQKQNLLLHTARLLKQPVENHTKSDPKRRSNSAPAGRRIPRTSTGEQEKPETLARSIRASSEAILVVKLEVRQPRPRGRSAPPLRFFSKGRENESPKENDAEDRRCYTCNYITNRHPTSESCY